MIQKRNQILLAGILVTIILSTLMMVYAGSFSNDSTSSTQQSVKKLILLLDTNDRDTARAVVRELGQNGDPDAVKILQELWHHDGIYKKLKYPVTYDDPVVRLMLASQLIKDNAPESSKFKKYIKSEASSRNWIIRANAADALFYVGDVESIQLLYRISLTPHQLVALRAIRVLEQLAREGSHKNLAFSVIEKLLHDSSIEDDVVKKAIQNTYNRLLTYRKNNQVKNNFIPFKKAGEQGRYNKITPELLNMAKNGDVKAQHALGEIYLLGLNTEKNYSEALYWLQAAADKDYAPAKASLAQIYLTGRGVQVDKNKAIQLLKEASEKGYKPATQLLDKLKTPK